jgi:hypothetical protein
MENEELKQLDNIELNNLLRKMGLTPCVTNDEDREIAINILTQLVKTSLSPHSALIVN